MQWLITGWYQDDNGNTITLPKEDLVMENAELIAFLGSIRYNKHDIRQEIYGKTELTTGSSLVYSICVRGT